MPFDAANPPAEVAARENMIALRDFLSQLPEAYFDMNMWSDREVEAPSATEPPVIFLRACDTAACIGGWADYLMHDEKGFSYKPEEVGGWLGLTDDQVDDLFYPGDYEVKDLPMAIGVINRYLQTGEIVWPK